MIEYLAAVGEGAGHVLSWPNILIPILGTLIAMIPSFLPGIGGTSLATLALLTTLNWNPLSVLLLFGALTGGATFMGSVTAILFNIPGNAAAAAAQIDGHPLSRNGYPRMAIAAAATASGVGSVIGVAILIAVLPVVRPFILEFGPPERLLLGLWGLSAIIAVPNTSALKATAAAALGLLAAMVGTDPGTAEPRWTFGSIGLYDGFDLVAMLLGFFTLSELVQWRRRFRLSQPPALDGPQDSIRAGILAVFRHFRLTLRCSALGTLIGAVPGIGGTVAGFVAYGQAVQTARGQRDGFGKGDIRGLIAPEAAVDAKDGGSLLPALAFGLPGSEAGVLLVTALTIHGFVPGIPMLTEDLSLAFALIFALLLSNIVTSVAGVAAIPLLARLTTLRIDRLVLPVLVASLVLLVELNGNHVDVSVAVGFGLLGYLFGRYDWPRIPFVITFVLGGFIEENLALTLKMADAGRIAPLERPVALFLAAAVIATLLLLLRGTRLSRQGLRPVAGERRFGLALAACPAALAAVALAGGYGAAAQITSVAATALCAAVLVRQMRTPAPPEPDRLPAGHGRTLVLLACLPPAVWSLGLAAASAGFVLLWLAGGQEDDGGGPAPARRARLLRAAMWAAATGAAVWLYLDRFAAASPPSPAILSLFP